MHTKKIAVVTGATSGLGAAASLALAARRFHVILVGRDEARARQLAAQIEDGRGAEVIVADLFTIAGTRRLAEEIALRAPRVDVLVNNAGGMFSKRVVTEDGLERTFALNVMAPFSLTEALMPVLSASRGRVVNVVTAIPKGARASLDQLMGPGAAAGLGAYTRAKLALAALTKEQARRHATSGVTFVSLGPGIIPGTRFGQEMPPLVRRLGDFVARAFGFASTLDEAAARYVSVATGPVDNGAHYAKGVLASPPRQVEDAAFCGALWAELARRSSPAALPEGAASPVAQSAR
jgi:NAD(P)-dependent dehydrogenase (short-subunit alcohol dehydrogenase family)